MNFVKTGILAALIALASPAAMATIIDFEGYNAGTIVDDEYLASHGISFNGVNNVRNADNLAVIFDTEDVTGGDLDLGAPFVNHNDNVGGFMPGNVLIIHEYEGINANGEDDCNGVTCKDPDDEGTWNAGYFDITFSAATTLNSIDFFDIEISEANRTNDRNLISLFDENGAEISPQTFYTPNTGGNNKWTRLDFNTSGVYSMRIKLKGSGAIDNINYTQVPEPSTFVIFSLALLGLVSRKLK